MSEYALAADRAGLQRYLLAGQRAHDAERDLWALAGITNGATVADVGCGPGAVAVHLGRLAGPGGEVMAIDQDLDALAMAGRMPLSR